MHTRVPILLCIVSLWLSVSVASCAEVQPTEIPAPRHAKTTKIDNTLLTIHDEYQRHLRNSADGVPFRPSTRDIQIIGDKLVIDAVADGDVKQLRQDLIKLGAVAVFTANSLVSCQIPITSLPELLKLKSLKSGRPSYVTTR